MNSAGYIQAVLQQNTASIGQRRGQKRQVLRLYPTAMVTQYKGRCISPFRIASSETDHSTGACDRNAIAQRTGQPAGYRPGAFGTGQDIDLIIPGLDSARPGSPVAGKIRTSGYDERTVADTRKSAGKAICIRQGADL